MSHIQLNDFEKGVIILAEAIIEYSLSKGVEDFKARDLRERTTTALRFIREHLKNNAKVTF